MPLEDVLSELDEALAKAETPPPPPTQQGVANTDELDRLIELAETDRPKFDRARKKVNLRHEFEEAPNETTLQKILVDLDASRKTALGGLQQQAAGLARTFGAFDTAKTLHGYSEENIAKAREVQDLIGGGTGPTHMLGATALQSIPVLLPGGLVKAAGGTALSALRAIGLAAGAQSFGGVEDEAYQAYLKAGASEKTAFLKSLAPAAASGLVTGLLTRYMPGGAEHAFIKLFGEGIPAKASVLAALKEVAKQIPKEAVAEFPEEYLDQLAQGYIAKFSYAPEKPTADIWHEALVSGLAGAALGGIMAGAQAPLHTGVAAYESNRRGRRYDTLLKLRNNPQRSEYIQNIGRIQAQDREAQALTDFIMQRDAKPMADLDVDVNRPPTPIPNAEQIPSAANDDENLRPPAIPPEATQVGPPVPVPEGSAGVRPSGQGDQAQVTAPPAPPVPEAPAQDLPAAPAAPEVKPVQPWTVPKLEYRKDPTATNLPDDHWIQNAAVELSGFSDLSHYSNKQLRLLATLMGSRISGGKAAIVADLRRKWNVRQRLSDATIESLEQLPNADLDGMIRDIGGFTGLNKYGKVRQLINYREGRRAESKATLADLKHEALVTEAAKRGDPVPDNVQAEYPWLFKQGVVDPATAPLPDEAPATPPAPTPAPPVVPPAPPSAPPAPPADGFDQALATVAPHLQRMGVSVVELNDQQAEQAGVSHGAGVAADVFEHGKSQLLVNRARLAVTSANVPDKAAWLKSLVEHEYVHFAQREVLKEAFDRSGKDPSEFQNFVVDHYQAIFDQMTPEQVAQALKTYLGREGTVDEVNNGEWGLAFEFVRQIIQGDRTGTIDEAVRLAGVGNKTLIDFLKEVIAKLKAWIAGGNQSTALTEAVTNVQAYLDQIEAPSQAGTYEGIADDVKTRLLAGQGVTSRSLKTAGLDAKQVQEWAELGVVQAAREKVLALRKAGVGDDAIFDALLSIYNRQPTFALRTSTSRINQAYSTPIPLAWLAGVLGGIENASITFEPTAGNGALLIGKGAGRVLANEFDHQRADRLRASGLATTVSAGDATVIKPVLTPSLVLMNPPFGTVLETDGSTKQWDLEGLPTGKTVTTSSIDHAIAMKGLANMAPDGTAVLIIGGPKHPNAQFYRKDFYHFLYELYNVVDHFTVDGDLYRKQGAGWPVDVIVIKGNGKSTKAHPATQQPTFLRTWNEVRNKIFQTPQQAPAPAPAPAPGPTGPPAGPRPPAPRPGSRPRVDRPSDGGVTPSPPPTGTGPVVSPPPRTDAGGAGKTGGGPPSGGGPSAPRGPAGVEGSPAGGPPVGGGNPPVQPGAPARRGLDPDTAAKLAEVVARNKDRIDRLKKVGVKPAQAAAPQPGPQKLTKQETEDLIGFAEDLLTSGITDFPKFLEAIAAALGESFVPYAKRAYEWHRAEGLPTSPPAEVDAYIQNRPPEAAPEPTAPVTVAMTEEPQVDYIPVSKLASGGFKVPRNLATYIRDSMLAMEQSLGMTVDEFVNDRLRYPAGTDISKYFFAEQVEAIAATIYNIEQGSSYIVGDMTGCVAAGTRIFNPKTGAHVPVEELAAAGGPTVVLALTSDGFKSQEVEAPFKKGSAPLYKVVLENGAAVTVTAEHRFLTELGWRSVGAGLQAGCFLGCGPNLPECSSDASPSAHGEDDSHCYRTPEDCLGDCSGGSHLYDGPLRMALEAVQVSFPLPSGVPGHSQQRFDEDDQAPLLGHNRPCRLSALHSKSSCAPLGSHGHAWKENPAYTSAVPRCVDLPQGLPRSLGLLASRRLGGEIGSSQHGRHGKAYASGNRSHWVKILSIEAYGFGAFYDIQVPGAENYLAEGIVHHNSGKGRVAAAVIAYSSLNGKIPVFVTAASGLYSAMLSDLNDIGFSHLVPVFTNNDMTFTDDLDREWKNTNNTPALEAIRDLGVIPGQALFTTYDQIKTDVPKGFTETPALMVKRKAKNQARPPGLRMEALQAIAHNSIFILDESHYASGKNSDTAFRIIGLLNAAKGAYYSSATFAKYPESMGVYFKTKMSEAGLSAEQLADVIGKGGLPLQQAVTAMLAEDGQYTRRETDYAGIPFVPKVSTATAERDKLLADEYMDLVSQLARLSRKVIAYINGIRPTSGTMTGIDEGSITGYAFASQMFLIARQFLLSLKAQAVVDEAVDAHNMPGGGEKPVIMLEGTMEGPLKEIQQLGFPLNFQGMLLRYIEKVLTVRERAPGSKDIVVRNLYQSLPPELQAIVDDLRTAILSSQIDALPLSPIDYVKHELAKKGIRIGELTGRTVGIDYATGKVYSRSSKDRSLNGKLRTLKAFNSDEEMEGLLYNAAAATGFSAQSAKKFVAPGKDPRKRRGIIWQTPLDINTAMQQLGRINRKGQDKTPSYVYLQTDIPAERRPAAIFTKRMASLNANTTSNTQTAVSALSDTPDIFNKYGDEAALRALQEHSDIVETSLEHVFRNGMQSVKEEFEKRQGTDKGLASFLSGHLVAAEVDDQTKVWKSMIAHYDTIINALNETGENDLEARAEDFQAESIDKKVIYDGAGTSNFSGPAYLERMTIKAQQKPLAVEEIMALAAENQAQAQTEGSAFLAASEAFEAAFVNDRKAKNPDFDPTFAFRHNNDIRNTVRKVMQMMGEPLRYKTRSGDIQYGTITKLIFDPASPGRLSEQKAVIHLNITRQKITLPLSNIEGLEENLEGDFRKLYDETAESSTERQIVTGNILGGFQSLLDLGETGGKVINFTTNTGQIKTGILLSGSFDSGSVVPVRSLADLQTALLANKVVTSPQGIVFRNVGGHLKIYIPANKARGGKFWRDAALAKLVIGGEFAQAGSNMVGEIDTQDDLQKAFDHLTTTHGQTFSYVNAKKAKPAQASALTPQMLGRTVTLEAGRGNTAGVSHELTTASAQNRSIIDIFSQVGQSIGASLATVRKLGVGRSSRVMALARTLHGVHIGGVWVEPSYADVIGSALPQGLKNLATRDMLQVLSRYGKHFDSVRKSLSKQEAKVTSGTFLRKVARMNRVDAQAKALEAAVTTFQSQMTAGMARAQEAFNASNASEQAIERGKAEYKFYHELLQQPEAIRQRAEDMVNTLWTTSEGQALLAGKGYLATGQDILVLFNRLKDQAAAANPNAIAIPHRGRNEEALNEAVANVIARAEEVRRDLVAAFFPPVLMANLTALEQELFDGIKKNPGRTLNRILKDAADTSSRHGQLMQLWRTLNKEVEKQLEMLVSLQDQVRLADAIENSLEWRSLWGEVKQQVGRVVVRPPIFEGRPEDRAHQPTIDEVSFAEWIPMPDGSSVDIELTPSQLVTQLPKLQHALTTLRAWLTDPVNMDQKDANGVTIPNTKNPYFEFWEMAYKRIEGIYATSLTMGNLTPAMDRDIRTLGLTTTNHGPWGMLSFLLKQAQIPAGRLATLAAHNWKAGYEQGGAWIKSASPAMNKALIAAARSHGLHEGNNASDQSRQWYNEVGNELFFSAQELGKSKKVGDLLGSGRKVTSADVAALRVIHNEVERLIRTNMRIGREGVMQESLIEDKNSVWRRALELGDAMLPRLFNSDHRSWVTSFHNILMEGRQHQTNPALPAPTVRPWYAYSAQVKAALLAHIDDWFNSFVYGFVSDRHPDFSRPSKWEPVYAELAEAMRKDREESRVNPGGAPLAPRTMQEVFNFIVARTPPLITPAEVEAGVMDEMIRQTENVFKQVFEETEARVETSHQRNAFTAPREARIANWFFYKHGFDSTPAMVGFGMDAASYWYERMMWALQGRNGRGGLLQAVELEKTAREKEVQRLTSQGNMSLTAARNQADKAHRAAQAYERMASQLRTYVQNLDKEFSSGGRIEREEFQIMHRVFGVNVGLALVTGNSVFNVIGTWRFLGNIISVMTNSPLTGHGRVFLDMAWELMTTVPRTAGRFVGYGLRNLPNAAMAGFKAKGGAKERAAAAIGEMFKDMGDRIFEHSAHYRDMVRLGYHDPAPLALTMDNRIMLGSTGGKIYQMDELGKGPLSKPLSEFLWGAVLNGIEIPVDAFRAFFPRGFDMIANIMSMRTAASMVDLLSSQLRRTFNEAGPGRFDFANPSHSKNELLPSELVPHGMLGVLDRLWPATTNNTKEIVDWFVAAGLPLQETVMAYFARLQGKTREQQNQEKLVTHEQLMQLGAILMEYVNKATPLNRPIQTRTSPFLRIITTFYGYWTHAARKEMNLHGPALDDPEVNRLWLKAMSTLGFMASAYVIGGLGYGYIEEKIRRWLYKFLYGEERAFTLPHEATTTTGKVRSAAAMAVGGIPLVGSFLSQYVANSPGRSSGLNAFAQNRINDIGSYVAGVIKTGDLGYKLPQLLSGILPLGKVVLNRLPSYEGVVEAKNDTRLLQRNADEDLIRKFGGGSGANVTRITPYGNRILNAIMKGDLPEALRLKAEAIEVGRKMGLSNPERTVEQMIEARNPITVAYRAKPTEQQLQKVFSGLSSAEAAYLREGLAKYQAGARALGASANITKDETLAARGGGGGYAGGGGGGGGGTSTTGSGSRGTAPVLAATSRRRSTGLRLSRGRGGRVSRSIGRRRASRIKAPRLKRISLRRRTGLRLKRPRTRVRA